MLLIVLVEKNEKYITTYYIYFFNLMLLICWLNIEMICWRFNTCNESQNLSFIKIACFALKIFVKKCIDNQNIIFDELR